MKKYILPIGIFCTFIFTSCNEGSGIQNTAITTSPPPVNQSTGSLTTTHLDSGIAPAPTTGSR